MVLNNYSGFGHTLYRNIFSIIDNTGIFGANGVSIKYHQQYKTSHLRLQYHTGTICCCIWRIALLGSEVVPVQKVGRNTTGQRLQNIEKKDDDIKI